MRRRVSRPLSSVPSVPMRADDAITVTSSSEAMRLSAWSFSCELATVPTTWNGTLTVSLAVLPSIRSERATSLGSTT